MSIGIIGRKIGMTQIFEQDGTAVAVTVVEAGPCVIVQKKSTENDGYEAVQLGFDKVEKEQRVSAPLKGHFKKNNLPCFKTLKEFKPENYAELSIGDEVKVDAFEKGDIVKVTGSTKGRGFTGTIKRFNTHRGPESHGSRYHRRTGSLGQNMSPGRVYKGVVNPGHFGDEQVTIRNLQIVEVMPEKNLILIKGGIPGSNKGIVFITK